MSFILIGWLICALGVGILVGKSTARRRILSEDGNVGGENIVILDEDKELGGALDALGRAAGAYSMSGSRMFEHHYVSTYDHLSFIPSVSDPTFLIKEETERAERDARWHNKARSMSKQGGITAFHELGFSERDRIDLIALLVHSEHSLDSKRITDCFQPHFFETNFWYEWCTPFAFERWHSAIEFRRYLLRFIHHFSTIDTQEAIVRTRS